MIYKAQRKTVITQVTFEGKKHPTSGTVFTLSWRTLKALIEKDFKNKKDRVISLKLSHDGIDVFNETEDSSAHFPLKVQG